MKLLGAAIVTTLLFIGTLTYFDFHVSDIGYYKEKIIQTNLTVPEEFEARLEKFEVIAYEVHPFQAGIKQLRISCPIDLIGGTQIFIPFFGETFICDDQSSGFSEKQIGVYVDNATEARNFGRRILDVYILTSRGE